ncbi:MAG: response regulator [Betaproteobacteria bacterium]
MTVASEIVYRGPHAGPPLPPKTFAGFALAFLAVILIGLFSYRSLEGRAATAERVTHTLAVREQIAALHATLRDAETGQRGYLLTGVESYLDPYTKAQGALAPQFKSLRELMNDRPIQKERLEALQRFINEKMTELEQTIELRRAGKTQAALDLVRTDRGKELMDRVRATVAEMENEERNALASRQAQWEDAVTFSFYITFGGSALLLLLIAAAAVMTSHNYRARQAQVWLRTGQMAFSGRIQGENRLDKLGADVLEFLAAFLGAQVGAAYVTLPDGRFQRVAGYAGPPGKDDDVLRSGDGLLGQAAKNNRLIHVRDIPEDYLPIGSSLGHGKPRELVVAPASADGVVQAVVELGFFRTLDATERALLDRISEAMGVAVRSSRDRTRLEELLEETQRQAEELQTQQEELRVNNEELEEQGRVLEESQARMETQQAELEQTNTQLEEQAQMLEAQTDELSRAQAVLTERAAELERANQYKSEFLANMSHELRTPLNSSLILSRLLAENKDGNLTAEQVKFAQTISSAGNDLLALINDILDLSKIESGKFEINPAPLDLASTIDALGKAFQHDARQKNVTLRTVMEPGAPKRMETDQQRLGQILKNLISNALKFTEKGEVSLLVSPARQGAGAAVSFTVRDTGIGIAAHQHEIIFEAFRQADGSTHRRYGGTGLGLSISRDLARLLGGDISLQSTPGVGSAFTLTLPLTCAATSAPAEAARPTIAPAPVPTSPAPEKRALAPIGIEDDRGQLKAGARLILVVEDDVRFATILRDMAREKGFQCVVTHTATEAIAAAQLYRPSGILLDVNLPDHSGLGVLDQLKHNPQLRHIPVHIASVADYAQTALERGAVGYSLKPVKREQLEEALRRLEAKFTQGLRNVLVVEDNERQRESIRLLLSSENVQIAVAASAAEALAQLQTQTFDCMVMDLNLPDLSGFELLETMAGKDGVSFPPVIVYTGKSLTPEEEQLLRRFSRSIIIKDARSPERLLDEVTLFLHQVESTLPPEHQRMLKVARDRDTTLEGRRILVVEDDVRNVFALTSLLEPKGAKVVIARNGREALDALARSQVQADSGIDLVLMDIMMPEMDGLTAMREIRKQPVWRKLPIIALTAKAMRDDQEKCLEAGANDYIAKPLDVEKLLSLVRVWMPK